MASSGSVKLEIEDPLEEQHSPLSKRSRLCGSSSHPLDQWSNGSNELPVPPSQYNPLDEPSPLGLRLRKSPSLLDLIQMRLSQSNASSMLPTSSDQSSGSKKEERGSTTSGATDKLKASNFTGSLLKIGSWEHVSRYEGDLVAKCYFAKHKIVWEILEGGLKSKIEIQWSSIMGLRADCPIDGPSTLTVALVHQPHFFRESNPQPRKHTLWQATSDFTDGQASINRLHILQCPPGVLDKHYEKLILCDTRLHFLSQQPEIVMDSPFFQSQPSAVENSDEFKHHGLDILDGAKGSPTTGVQSISSPPTAGQSSSLSFEQDVLNGGPEHSSKDAPSPSSVMDTRAIEGNGKNLKGNDSIGRDSREQLKVPGLHQSMSMTDLVNHIGNCISEQVNSGNMHSNQASECQSMLENIAHILMSDNQSAATSDEKSLMKKVNSLCCLLQDPATINNTHINEENHFGGPSHEEDKTGGDDIRQAPSMTRRDSFADLLFQLPRIASFPKFLFDIAEDDRDQP